MVKRRKNSWKGLSEEIFSRLRNAIVTPQFVASFIIGVMAISGIGIWLPYLANKAQPVIFLESENLFTYSMAILGILLVDAVLIKSNDRNNNLASIGMLLGVLAFGLVSFGYYKIGNGFSLTVTIGTILTLILFLFATVNDPKFDSEDDESDIDPAGYIDVNSELIKDR